MSNLTLLEYYNVLFDIIINKLMFNVYKLQSKLYRVVTNCYFE